jgi:uncharacterized spore protein YtfJ
MDVPLPDVFEDVVDSATVRRVYGDPVEADGRTVLPVARVAYGVGGGHGAGSDGEETGEGWGGGGGAAARPVGALEISDAGTRFVRYADPRRLLGALLAGVALGYLLGRRS